MFDYLETYAAVAKSPTWRILLYIAASLDWHIEQIDVVAAFLHGELDEDVYAGFPAGLAEFLMDFPEENDIGFHPDEDQVLHLQRPLYGLKQAPRQWQKRLNDVLKKRSFSQCKSDSAIYISTKERVVICTYVDDLLLLGKSRDTLQDIKKDLQTEVDIKDLESASYFLGVRITRDRANHTIKLSQDAYAKRTIEDLGFEDLKPAKTPFASGSLVLAMPNQHLAHC